MAHEEQRGTLLSAQLPEQLEGLERVPRVQVARRLVREDEPWRPPGRAPGRRAAAGRWRGGACGSGARRAEPREALPGRRPPGRRTAQHHVLQGRVAAEEVERLEHVPELARPVPIALGLGGRSPRPPEAHRASVGRQDPSQDVEEGRLARAAGARDGDLLTGLQGERRHLQDALQLPQGRCSPCAGPGSEEAHGVGIAAARGPRAPAARPGSTLPGSPAPAWPRASSPRSRSGDGRPVDPFEPTRLGRTPAAHRWMPDPRGRASRARS